MSKKLSIALFVLLALVQIYVPLEMILHKENILKKGKEFRFKTAPIDPYDAFRGMYVSLRFQERKAKVDNAEDWERNEIIYLSIVEDEQGYARIVEGFKEEPSDGLDFIEARVDWPDNNEKYTVNVDLPFDRFYMEESKSDRAETVYRDSNRDEGKEAVAVVNVMKGDAVLRDVTIDGKSLVDIVREEQELGE